MTLLFQPPLSEPIRRELEHYRVRLIPRFPWWLSFVLIGEVSAITLGRRIYLSARVGDRPPEWVERLLRHELEHVRQFAHRGILRFLARYLGEYLAFRFRGLSHLQAYRSISFERDARKAEEIVEDDPSAVS